MAADSRRAWMIINVVYVASFVSPGGIHPGSFIRRYLASGSTRSLLHAARGIIGARARAYTHARIHNTRVIRTPPIDHHSSG